MLINITIGDNGLFTNAKLGELRFEYLDAKKIIDVKLVTIRSKCVNNPEMEYTLNTIANSMAEQEEVSIDVMNFYTSARLKQGLSLPGGTISGIVVIANEYPRFEFLIGEISEGKIGIKGVAFTEDNPISENDFTDLASFEKNTLGLTTTIEEENDVGVEPIGSAITRTIPTIPNDVDTTGDTIEVTSYLSMQKYSKIELSLDGVSQITYRIVSKTSDNININNGIITTTNKANTSDYLVFTITGKVEIEYNEKDYMNTITVFVEPNLSETVFDYQGNEHPAFAINSINDLVRFRDLINYNAYTTEDNNGNPIKNAALKKPISLNTICYEVDGTTQNDISWTPIGNSTNKFTGIFEGRKNSITDLYINNSNTEVYNALFGEADGAYINGLKVYGQITSDLAAGVVGGITNGVIKQCGNHVTINSEISAGGIASYITSSIVTQCYNKANITTTNYNGGIVGNVLRKWNQ